MQWVAGHTARLFYCLGQHSPPARQQQPGAGSGKESQFTVSTKCTGGGGGGTGTRSVLRIPVVSPQKRIYRNLNTGYSMCQGNLKEVTGYFIATFLKRAACVCLKKNKGKPDSNGVSCEIPEYFL